MTEAPTSSTPEIEALPYRSLDELKSENELLLVQYQEASPGERREAVLNQVKNHVARGIATGGRLSSNQDRWEAQSLLDYWISVFYREGLNPPESTLVDYDPRQASQLDDRDCPYPGLQALLPDQPYLPYGRTELLKTLLDKIEASPGLLTVVGPSDGEHSLVVLGALLPALKAGKFLPGSDRWRYLPVLTPGHDPLADLASVLPRMSRQDSPDQVARDVEAFRRRTDHLRERLRALEENNVPVVLVIDRFDEIYNQSASPGDRKAFFANLSYLLTFNTRIKIIITVTSRVLGEVRKAFRSSTGVSAVAMGFFRLSRRPDSEDFLPSTEVLVPPMSQAEIQAAVLGPAESVDLNFEDGLVDQIVEDTYGDPSCLPLLQFSMLALWDRREGNLIAWDQYSRLGAPRQALVSTAEGLYQALDRAEQALLEALVLDLTGSSSLGVAPLRRARVDTVSRTHGKDETLRLLGKLNHAGLLLLYKEGGGVRSRDETPDPSDSVELLHATLVREWPTAARWLDRRLQAGGSEYEHALQAERARRERRNLWRSAAALAALLMLSLFWIGHLVHSERLESDRIQNDLGKLQESLDLARDESYIFRKYHGDSKIDSKDLVAVLKILDRGDAGSRAQVARMLGKSGVNEAVPGLLIALRDQDSDLRKSAAEALGILRPASEEVARALAVAVNDRDRIVGREAVRALGLIGPQASAAVPALTAALGDQDPSIRGMAADSLGLIGPGASEGTGALADSLKDDNVTVRVAAARALGRIGPPAASAVPTLMTALGDLHETVQKEAREALVRIGTQSETQLLAVVAGLDRNLKAEARIDAARILGQFVAKNYNAAHHMLTALADADQKVRDVAILALGDLPSVDEGTVKEVARLLKDPDPGVRDSAARTLERLGKKAARAAPDLAICLRNDKDAMVRRTAAEALGAVGVKNQAAIEAVTLAMLNDPDVYVRVRAVETLALIGKGDKRGTDALVSVLTSKNNGDRQQLNTATLEALYKMSIENSQAAAGFASALVSDDPAVRKIAIDMVRLGSLESKAILPSIFPYLKDGDDSRRLAAVTALGKLDPYDERVFLAYCAALEDKDEKVRGEALRAIVERGRLNESTVTSLIESLKTKQGPSRSLTIEALMSIGNQNKNARNALMAAIEHPDVRIRLGAIEALGSIYQDAKLSTVALAHALRDRDEDIQIAAAQALGNLGRISEAATRALPDLTFTLTNTSNKEAVRQAAADAIRMIGANDAAAVKLFTSTLSDRSERIRLASVAALHKIGPKQAGVVTALTTALNDQSRTVRTRRLQALAEMSENNDPSVAALARALKVKDDELRNLSKEALIGLGPRAVPAVSILTELVGDTRPSVRLAAIEILKNLGRKATPALPALNSALVNADESTRKAIQSALHEIDPKE